MDRLSERVAATFRVRGTVQGVGFRPFVYRVARARGIAGWVCNDADGVLIRAEGSPADLARFREALPREAPPSAVIVASAAENAERFRGVGLALRLLDDLPPARRPVEIHPRVVLIRSGIGRWRRAPR